MGAAIDPEELYTKQSCIGQFPTVIASKYCERLS